MDLLTCAGMVSPQHVIRAVQVQRGIFPMQNTRMSLMSDPLHIARRLLWLVPPPFWEYGKERDGWFCCYSTRRETGLFSPYSAPLFSVSTIYSFKRV